MSAAHTKTPKRKKRMPGAPAAETTVVWAQTPLLTRIPRPASGRPISATRPPKSIGMTLHYSRARMDASSPVRDAAAPGAARARPATAGTFRDELVPGGTRFYDSTTGEGLGGAVRRRPSTARGNLGGQHLQTSRMRPKFTAADRMSSTRLFSAHESPERTESCGSAVDDYHELLMEADNEVEEMVQSERPAQSAKGSKKNEFEYVETLLRTPRRIQLRKKIEQIEEEIDPRKEALTAYQEMCVRMRMPCEAHLSVEQYELDKAARIQREALRLNRDPEEIKEESTQHEYASPQKIEAMSAALYNTLRKKKKKKPPPEPSWRDKFDHHGNLKADPWWARAPEDPFEDQAFLHKYLCPQ